MYIYIYDSLMMILMVMLIEKLPNNNFQNFVYIFVYADPRANTLF